jgi:hypothetical protein
LDVHSICLPSRSKKAINWGIHYEPQYEEEFNPQIIYSPIYQELYSRYLALKEQQSQEKNTIKQVAIKTIRKFRAWRLLSIRRRRRKSDYKA